jgi:hypothetical protein
MRHIGASNIIKQETRNKVEKLAYDSNIQYLYPEQNDARIAHYARIANVAQKWLALVAAQKDGQPIPEVPPLSKKLITIEGGLPPLPGTNVIMPILP